MSRFVAAVIGMPMLLGCADQTPVSPTPSAQAGSGLVVDGAPVANATAEQVDDALCRLEIALGTDTNCADEQGEGGGGDGNGNDGGVVTTHAGDCRVGLRLGPGGSCNVDIPSVNVGSNRFEIRSDGRGCYGSICAGTGMNLNGFRASRIAGTRTWRIDALP